MREQQVLFASGCDGWDEHDYPDYRPKQVTNLGPTREMILKILKDHGPLIDEEIQEYFEKEVLKGWIKKAAPSNIRSRRKSLLQMGMIKEYGELRKTKMGRLAILWTLSEAPTASDKLRGMNGDTQKGM